MMRWRSPREIAFRARQEFQNVWLWMARPRLPAEPDFPCSLLPDPAACANAIRGTRTAAHIVACAEGILEHRFPVLGLEIETGPEIHWRRDEVNGQETGLSYFRRIPYLDLARAGDHKMIWELNRHQHLVLLSQAWLLSGRAEYLAEIRRQIESWVAANPFQRGINGTSALEVAFRALSWLWILHLTGQALDATLRRLLLEELYRHGLYLAWNLSYYFSPNTHLLGEAVALHALGILFRDVKGQTWESTGAALVAQQLDRQVRNDGSHFEQSTYYHVYALDMFLFHAVLAAPNEDYRRTLARMGECLDAWMGPARSLPLIGDDDGGRFFHPFGPKERFGLATLAACGTFLGRQEWIVDEEAYAEQGVWWLGPQRFDHMLVVSQTQASSHLFSDAGAALMIAGSAFCAVDAGPFGPLLAGHSHADTLSVVARHGGQELLIDPGTFTYVGDAHWRDVFRGTAAHNTIRIRGLDQADPGGPFCWRHTPTVEIRQWECHADADYLDAECRYRDCRHRRRVLFLKPDFLFILDEVHTSASPGQPYAVEQFWHPGRPVDAVAPGCFRIAGSAFLLLDFDDGGAELTEGEEYGWRSRAFGVKEPWPVILKKRECVHGGRFGAVLAFPGAPAPRTLIVKEEEDGIVRMILAGTMEETIVFAESGLPRRE